MNNTLKEKLIELADEDYRKFNSGLIPNVSNILGVRMPQLHRLAREISGGDWRAYLEEADDEYFEETMLQGLVIGYAKTDVEEILRHVVRFVPKINNWAICDIFCSNLKMTKQNREQVWDFLQPYMASDREFEIRFGVIMMLTYYIDETYIGHVLRHLDSIRHEGYYARMAVAWALSVCFVKLPERTMPYLKNNSLDDFTYNRALQKIIESNQVDKGTKDIIRRMKRSRQVQSIPPGSSSFS